MVKRQKKELGYCMYFNRMMRDFNFGIPEERQRYIYIHIHIIGSVTFVGSNAVLCFQLLEADLTSPRRFRSLNTVDIRTKLIMVSQSRA